MGKQTTRDAALSRLFGNAPEAADDPGAVRLPHGQNVQREPALGRAGPKDVAPGRHGATSATGGESRGGANYVSGGRTTAEPQASGYIGLGRYSRSDGIVERITPYVRPDQAEALRLAVARKSDPRGTDISQIIQSLLDEAGYSA
jgi:hypothetical protein